MVTWSFYQKGGLSTIWTNNSDPAVVQKRIRTSRHDGLHYSLIREYVTLQQCSHPHIIKCLGLTITHKYAALTLPFFPQDLSGFERHIHDAHRRLLMATRILQQIGSALMYLHKKDILHGDIKPANILVSDQLHVVLADFGSSRLIGHPIGQRGTTGFCAPEVLAGGVATFASDIYSLGRTLLTLVTSESDHKLYMLATAMSERKPTHRPSLCDIIRIENASRFRLAFPHWNLISDVHPVIPSGRRWFSFLKKQYKMSSGTDRVIKQLFHSIRPQLCDQYLPYELLSICMIIGFKLSEERQIRFADMATLLRTQGLKTDIMKLEARAIQELY